MRYTDSFVKQVLGKTDIVDIISKVTDVSKVDQNTYMAKCPFHKSDEQLLMLNKEKQYFHCFDCGANGNAIAFLSKYHNLSFDKTVELLARKLGIEPQKTDIVNEQPVLKSNLRNIYKDATAFYQYQLSTENGKDALAYLEHRGLTKKTIEEFKLGFAPAKGNALIHALSKKGYSEELMLEAGLAKRSEKGYLYDFFRNRVMFPVMDEECRPIAFGGRVLDDSKPKYLNSPETLIFNKSTTLYGMHDWKNIKQNYIILCEGNVDMIRLHQEGFKNSGATLGTSFTQGHIPLIKKYANNLILSFDSDEAGKKAALKAIGIGENVGMGIRVMSLDPYKDPDDLLKDKGAKEYKQRLLSSIDKIDFKIKCIQEQYDIAKPEEKKAFLNKAVKTLMNNQELEKFKQCEITR